jgi:hypothetical protein
MNDIDQELTGVKKVSMCPIFSDKILIGAKDMLYIVDLNGKVHQKYESSFPGWITGVQCNSKFIYVVQHLRSKEGHLAQYDMEFNLINDVSFAHRCLSFSCTESKVLYAEPFGYESNFHLIIHALNANTLETEKHISNEVDDDDDMEEGESIYYCPDFAEDAPQIISHSNRFHFVYDTYGRNSETTNRVDIAHGDTLAYIQHVDMPSWFMDFQFDATGQFVNYFCDKDLFGLFSKDCKPIGEFRLEENKAKKKLSYCCTNDGHLVVLKNNSDFSVY